MLKTQPLAGAVAFLIFFSLLHSCSGESDGETFVVFKGDTTEISNKEANEAKTKLKPNAFRVPAFVGGVLDGKEFLAVFCDAHYKNSSGSPFIAPAIKTSKENYRTWSDAVIFGKDTENEEERQVMGIVTAVMHGNKIYALATSFVTLDDMLTLRDKNTTDWDTVMFVGTVERSTDSEGDKGMTVKWEKPKSLKYLLGVPGATSRLGHFFGGVGNAVVMKNGKIVFPIQMVFTVKAMTYNQASSIIYSDDNGTTWHMGSPILGLPTSECSVVEWGDGKLLLSVRYDSGYRIIYESDSMGVSWKEFVPLTRVWGNDPKNGKFESQGSAITASVDKKDILLVAHPLNTKNFKRRETLQLWVSDGKRISCVGTISKNGKGEQTGNSILALVGDNLYVTHEINPYGNLNEGDATSGGWDKVIAISPLKDFFNSAKNTVGEWQRLDEWFQSSGIPAHDLVGVLGNTTEDVEVWPDVYNCVNATVKNAKSVEGGFQFNGTPNSYAKWPVENQGQNQFYKFTDKQFTLTATVIIHNTSGAGDVSFFGIGETNLENEILFGLGYTEEKKLYTLHSKSGKSITQFSFELDKEYNIAITFNSRWDIVYVDGVEITESVQRAWYRSSVDFFYMGGAGEGSATHGSNCTIKNVMLFNRRFNKKEIARLSNIIKYGYADEETSTEEPTTLPETTEEVSTEEQTTLPQNSAPVSIQEQIREPENKEVVLIPNPLKQSKAQNPVTTKEPAKSPQVKQTVSTTAPTNSQQRQEASSTGEQKSSAAIKETVSTAGLTKQPETQNTVTPEEQKMLQETQEVESTTETTSLPQIEKAVSKTQRKQTAVTEKQEINIEREKGKNVNFFEHYIRNNAFEEQINRADSASVQVTFFKFMCFTFSIFVLA